MVGVRVNEASFDGELSNVKALGLTTLPVTPSLVQMVQLQREPRERSSSTSKVTSPQTQEPWCLVTLSMSTT